MKIKLQEVATAFRQIEVCGDPPKRKHWILRDRINEFQYEVGAIRTIHSRGMLRVNRQPNALGESIKDGRFNITCAHTGLRITSFGTKRVAKAFVDRVGPGWSKLFASICASEETNYNERLYGLLASVGRLFHHDDMGEDDGDLPYIIAGNEFLERHVPKSWMYPRPFPEGKGVGETPDQIAFGGPCAVICDGFNGKDVVWVMQGCIDRSRGLFMGTEKAITWLRFRSTPSGTPTVEEFQKLKCALEMK